MKTMINCLFSRATGRLFCCFLGLYIALMVNCQAAGFVDVSSVSLSEMPVTIGQNFKIGFVLQEYKNDWKSFEYIEVWIQNKKQEDLYVVKRWNNISIPPNSIQSFLATTFLRSDRAPGDYFIVVRGKEYGGNPFNFQAVPGSYAACPYKFSAISPIKADVVFSSYDPARTYDYSEGLTVGRGNDGKGGVATYSFGMAFDVPWTSSFKLSSISLLVDQYIYDDIIPATLIVSINEDLNGLPGKVLEQFAFSNFHSKYFILLDDGIPLWMVFLTGTSTRHPVLFSGKKYWVTASVSEPTMMLVVWRIFDDFTIPRYPHAVRINDGQWTYGDGNLTLFRVMGTPTSGGGGNKDDTHVAFVRVATVIDGPTSFPEGIAFLPLQPPGHSWIEVMHLSSKTKETWGTYGNKNPQGLYHDLELSLLPIASRSMFVTQKEYEKLLNEINKYENNGEKAWSLAKNCTEFAKDAWKAVSGEKINPYWIYDVELPFNLPRPIWPNPVSVMYSIINLNGDMSERTINKCNSPYCSSPCPPPAIFCY